MSHSLSRDRRITLNLVPCVTGVYREDAMYFKVLRDGKSCHGGSHTWGLNEWDTSDPPVIYRVGFHVTEEPALWYEPGCTVYVAETAGMIVPSDPTESDPTKVSAERCRIVREATKEELAERGVYLSGSHVCRRTRLSKAYGSASVE